MTKPHVPAFLQILHAGQPVTLAYVGRPKRIAAPKRPIARADWKRIQCTLMRAGGLRAVYRFDPALIDMNRSVRWWAIQAKAEAPRCPD